MLEISMQWLLLSITSAAMLSKDVNQSLDGCFFISIVTVKPILECAMAGGGAIDLHPRVALLYRWKPDHSYPIFQQ